MSVLYKTPIRMTLSFLGRKLLILFFHVYRREMLHQQTMDENISTADFAEEYPLGAVIEEGDDAKREKVIEGDDEAQSINVEFR